MTANSIVKMFSGLIFLLACGSFPAYAEVTDSCDADELLRELSSEPVGYERIERTLLGVTTEGAGIEYYYSTDVLKRIKSVFAGETGKIEVQYYFDAPDVYAAKVTHYYYSTPIYSDDFQIVSTNKSEFVVCRGELTRGIFDELVVEDFEYAEDVLETVLAETPR